MITFRGAVLVAIGIFTFLLARLTQVGWLYLLDAALWGVVLFSFVLPWLSVMTLSVRRRVVRLGATLSSLGPSEGETVQLELWLDNGRRWPRYFLSVSYDCPIASPAEQGQRFFVPRLDGGDSLLLASDVECYRRGMHEFGVVTVESKAPFGLFRRRVRLRSPLSVLVYPQVFPLQRLALLEGTQGTAARPQKTRSGQEVAGSRHYFPGDPLRHIHWRNTARVGRPMVREFEDTQDNTLVIAFDSSKDIGEDRETVLEYSIKVAATVAGYAIGRGANVRVLTGKLPRHEMPWPALLKELALIEPGDGPGLADLVEALPPGARVLAIVSEEDDRGAKALPRQLGGMGGLAVVLMRGFGGPEQYGKGETGDALTRIGAPVVTCMPGELPETLASLERLQWPTGAQSIVGQRT